MARATSIMHALVFSLLVMSPLGAQANVGRTKQEAPPDIPEIVFTLKMPNKIKLPAQIQNFVMYCIKMSPSKETLWRDEYSNICNNKKALITWLDEKIDDALANERAYILEQFKEAADKWDEKAMELWMNRMGGWKEEDRYKWFDSHKAKGESWRNYIQHGW